MKIKTDKILAIYFFSFFIYVIIAAMLMFAVYHSSKDILMKEIETSNNLVLENVRQLCDSRLSYIEKLTVYMGNNDQALYWGKNFDQDNVTWRYDSRKLIKEFNWYNEITGNYEDAFLYFSNADIVVNNENYIENEYIYEKLNLKMTYQQWVDTLSNDTGNSFAKIETNDGETKFLYVARNFYTRTFGKANMSFVVIFNFDYKGLNLNGIKDFPIGLYIVDGKNNFLNLYADSKIKTKELETIQFQQQEKYYWAGGEKYLNEYCKSNVWGLTYVIFMPYDEIFRNMNILRILFYIILIIWVLMGMMFGMFLTKKNYRIIDDLFGKLQRIKKSFNEEGEVSFSNIDKFIEDVIDYNENLLNDNKRREKILKETAILRLINGDYTANGENNLSLCGLSFTFDFFEVVIIRFVCEDTEALKLYTYAVANMAEEILSNQYKCNTAIQDTCVVCIINCSNDGDLKKDIKKCYHTITSVMMEEFQIEIIFAVSSLVKGIHQVRSAYVQALFLADHQIIFHDNDILFYEDAILSEYSTTTIYDMETENCLLGAIETNNPALASDIIDRVFEKWAGHYEPFTIKKVYIGYDIYCSLIKVIEKNAIDQKLIQNVFEIGNILNKTDSLYDIKNLLKEAVVLVCSNLVTNHKKTILIEERVMNYIEQEYANPNLGLTMIAEHMGMHPTYLSNSFKSQCGYGILEGITKVRMSKALPMLKDGSLTVDQISKKIGYLNFRTFTTKFKTIYGMTPTEYMKISGKKETKN